MKPVWHPLSTILIAEPRCFATVNLVRMLLGAQARLPMIYAGDRMWPAVTHGSPFELERLADGPVVPGSVVLVARDGIPDLLRVASARGDALSVAADADPRLSAVVPRAAVLARAVLPARASSRFKAGLRRFALDFREAWRGRPDPDEDPAETVRDKYETQAAHYARAGGPEMEPSLLGRVRSRLAERSTVLVVGSGVGSECFALAGAGYRVTGLDFSPSMVRFSNQEASRRGLDIEFVLADVREYRPDEGSFGALFFTYDVYSFLPDREARVALLRRTTTWLAEGGPVFLSARRARSRYERAILGVQWLALKRVRAAELGDSHTRWIPGDGSLRRSFVHVFTDASLRAEVARAGLRIDAWEGGHGILSGR